MLRNISKFGRKRSKRIALIDEDGLSVFVLDKGQLVHDAKFSDEDFGHENFRYYLAEHARTPITVLVDTVAEDFIVESLPHVSYYDRKGFLNRKSLQHFRGLDYRSSSVVDREKGGRKNDKVLFSALTKNQVVESWLRAMLQEEIPIQGVTTPAFALCKVAEHFDFLSEGCTLIVNWEKTGIRQTFVNQKKMMFSRLSQLPSGERIDLAAEIMDSCIQSKDYLERIGLLKFDQRLDLHIITPQLTEIDFESHRDNGNFHSIQHHRPADMLSTDEYNGPEETKTAVLLCLNWGVRSGQLANRYGGPSVQRFYDLGQVRRIIYTFSISALILSIGVSLPLFFDAVVSNSRIDSLREQTEPVRLQYDALTAQFPETPIPSDAMVLAVTTHELISGQAYDPRDLMGRVSQVVARFPAVSLSSLEWELRGRDENDEITRYLLDNEAMASIDLIGSISGGNIATSQRQLSVFLQALGNIEGATAIPISLPVESGPDGEVSTVIDDVAIDADFAIRVTLDN